MSDPVADMTIMGPCGHVVDFFESAMRVDDHVCPICGLWWGVEQAAPVRGGKGMWLPGERRVVIRGTRLDRMRKQAEGARPGLRIPQAEPGTRF